MFSRKQVKKVVVEERADNSGVDDARREWPQLESTSRFFSGFLYDFLYGPLKRFLCGLLCVFIYMCFCSLFVVFVYVILFIYSLPEKCKNFKKQFVATNDIFHGLLMANLVIIYFNYNNNLF